MHHSLSPRVRSRFTDTHWISRDGTPVFIRPIRPADVTPLKALFQKVKPEDIRLKFFGAVNIDEKAIAQLTGATDLDTAVFIAERSDTEEIAGFAKWKKISDVAEFAILVRSDLKNHGFGWLLMQAIIRYSIFRQIRELRGDVLAFNANMLDMCRELGFAVTPSSSDPHCMSVKLDLQKPFLA